MAFRKGGKGTGASQGDTRSTIPINQTAHGFTVPQAVYLDDGDGLYKLAKTDVLATANAIGIISSVQDANNFSLTTAGAKNIFTGLTEGSTYYVSESTAGALTETAPDIMRPILNAISATRGIIFTDAVIVDPSSSISTIYSATADLTSNRIVRGPNGISLKFNCFDTADLETSTALSAINLDADEAGLAWVKRDGLGTTIGENKIVFSESSALVLDSLNSRGLQYSQDYSAAFISRSLVDKGYVDNNAFYNANGVISEARTVEISNGNALNITAFDQATHSVANEESRLALDSDEATIELQQLDGAGVVTSFAGLSITSTGGMLVTDTTDTAGLKYAADYSANFTARSLVDKGYADSISTIFNASGNIAATRVINSPLGRMLSFNAFDVNDFSDSNMESFIQVVDDDVRIGYLALDGAGGIDGVSQFLISASDMTVTDSNNNQGMLYASDYSANYTDRSLVDKGYSDLGHLARVESGAANLTSSGKPILAVTDSSAPRTVTIATSDVIDGSQFIVKDEFGDAGMNPITVTTPTISVTSVASGTSGSDFLTSTAHGYSVGQRIIHASFVDGDYNGFFTVTDIVSTTRYEVSTITFVATDAGDSNVAIDGQSSFSIGVDYGSLEFYCNDNQVFTKGGGNTALAARSATTGLLDGGDMFIVSGSTLDISASEGQIVDQSDPANTVITPVSIAADPAYLITSTVDGVYIIAIDVTSSIVEIDLATLTTEERHQFVMIGGYVRAGGNAVRILNEPINVGYGVSTGLSDFASDVIGPVNQQGNVISANGVNLSIDTTGGVTFIVGQNFRNDPDKPHQRTLPSVSVITFRHSYIGASGELLLESGGADFTVIDPDQYNVTPGSLSATPNNNWTIQVLFAAPAGIYNVAFGQEAFSTSANAVTALQNGTVTFVEIEAFLDQVKIAYIIVKQGVTDLSTAIFMQASKFRMDTPA